MLSQEKKGATMSDSVPSLVDVFHKFSGWGYMDEAGTKAAHEAILAYSRHHDPAWKAAREGSAAWESTEFRTSTRTLRLCRE